MRRERTDGAGAGRSLGPWALCWLLLAASLALGAGGCLPIRTGPAEPEPVVFLLDSPVNRAFLEGRGAGLTAADITHGSLVARVLRSYCRARLISIPVEGPDSRVDRRGYLSGLRSVLDYRSRHPRSRIIVNVSLSSGQPDEEERHLIETLVARGVLIVAAAGNSDTSRPAYPAAYPGVVAVASATPEGKALHSNYGPHVDIAASGDISFIDYEYLPFEWLRREMEARGTSFAAPRVSATVAYVLDRRPEFTPLEACSLLEATARPIRGPHYRDGLLGAGLLDIRAAKTDVAPVYAFAHFVLPVCVWVVMGALSGWLVVRRGFGGMLLSALMWFVVLPLSFLLVVRLGRWVEFVGRGDLVVGLGILSMLLAGAAISLLVQRRAPVKLVPAVGLPVAAFHASALLWPMGESLRMGGAGAAALAMVALSVWLERRAKARARAIGNLEDPGAPEVVDRLLKAHRWSLDPRVRRAALAQLARTGDRRVVRYLLHAIGRSRPLVDALAGIAARDIGPFVPQLGRFGRLGREARRRLLLALRAAGNPAARPHLEELLHRFSRRDVRETLEGLPDSPRAGDENEATPREV